jgi:hypothetical protein
MSDQLDRTPEPGAIENQDADSPRRSIPDGGLGAAMPAWLRQPPPWKQPPVQAGGRSLPEPDTSAIDPATMLDDDDLPQWLRDLAAPTASSTPVSRVTGAAEATAMPDEPMHPPAISHRATAIVPDDSNRTFPSVGKSAPSPEPGPASNQAIPKPPPWWMSNLAIGILLIAIVLTMVYVILAASGVL